MTSQKYTGLFYSDFDPNMKVATNEKDLLKKMKEKKTPKKKKESASSINMKKDNARKASDLNIGVVNYDK